MRLMGFTERAVALWSAVMLSAVLLAPPSLGQEQQNAKSQSSTTVSSAPISVPPVKPVVDQLGQMKADISTPDRAGLVIMLYLQVILLVVLAIVFVAHWPLMRPKKKGS